MTGIVFHYTDTARLAWILHDGELHPGRCRVGGFPDPDFLWATTSLQGDRTASAGIGGFREGVVRLARISLSADAFSPWKVAADEHPDWTPDHVSRLEETAIRVGASKADIAGWFCRTSALPTSAFVSVETRSWSNKNWKPLHLTDDTVIYAKQGEKVAAGVEIDGVKYFAERVEGPDGRRGYGPFRT